jgi:hypothetical protein
MSPKGGFADFHKKTPKIRTIIEKRKYLFLNNSLRLTISRINKIAGKTKRNH